MRKLMKGTMLAVGTMASSLAMAVPQYQSWDVTTVSGFLSWSPSGVTGSDPVATLDGQTGQDANAGEVFRQISWGNGTPEGGNQQSSLFADGVPVTVATNGAFGLNGELTHNNFPITGTTLTEAFLLSQVELTVPAAAGGPTVPSPIVDSINIEIDFIETPNNPASGTCANGEPNGVGVNINDCADIFVATVAGALVNEDGFIERSLGSLGDPDYTYTALVQIDGAVPLDAISCSAAGSSAPCIGFETIENQTNQAVTRVAIRATPNAVPAPAPVLGLGLGLLLMARARRRKA